MGLAATSTPRLSNSQLGTRQPGQTRASESHPRPLINDLRHDHHCLTWPPPPKCCRSSMLQEGLHSERRVSAQLSLCVLGVDESKGALNFGPRQREARGVICYHRSCSFSFFLCVQCSCYLLFLLPLQQMRRNQVLSTFFYDA